MNTIVRASTASQSGSKLDNRRILAALIDLAVVGAGAAAILVAAGVLGGDGAPVGAPLAAVVAGWAMYYYFACESGGGQTLGKKLLGLRVVTVDGRAPGMRDVAVRTVLRLVDTALVGLVSMLATGERRARLGDMAAGTMIVSTDAAPAPRVAAAAPVVEAPEAEAPAEDERPPVPEMRPFEPFEEEEAEVAPDAPYTPVLGEGFEEEPAGEEPTLGEPVADEPVVEVGEPVVGVAEPVVEAQVVHAVEPAGAEPGADEAVADAEVVEADEPAPDEPAGDAGETLSDEPAGDLVEPDFGSRGADQPAPAPVELSVVEQPAVELSVIEAPPAVDPASDGPAAAVEAVPATDHSLDIATPTMKELARDVQAAKAQPDAAPEPLAEVAPEPAVEPAPEPVVEVEVAGPEVDVDEPGMTVRSVETVSAIDLIMGGGESSQDEPADEHPPATA